MPKTKYNEIIQHSSKLDPMKYIYSTLSESKPLAKQKLYRQGDILFKKVDAFPALHELKNKPDSVVAEGEMTGHAHVLVNGAVFEHLNSNKTLYIKADQHTRIIHDEHLPIKLDEGKYEVIQQREYLGEGDGHLIERRVSD